MVEGETMKCGRRNRRERGTGVMGVSKKPVEALDYSGSVNICPFKLMDKKYCMCREYLLRVCTESFVALPYFSQAPRHPGFIFSASLGSVLWQACSSLLQSLLLRPSK